MEFLWEYYQHGRIAKAESKADAAVAKTVTFDSDVKSLHAKLDRVVLLNQALWSLLKSKTDLSDQALMNEIQSIDMRDGKLDGKVAETKQCLQCSTVLQISASSCYRCGAQSKVNSAFHQI